MYVLFDKPNLKINPNIYNQYQVYTYVLILRRNELERLNLFLARFTRDRAFLTAPTFAAPTILNPFDTFRSFSTITIIMPAFGSSDVIRYYPKRFWQKPKIQGEKLPFLVLKLNLSLKNGTQTQPDFFTFCIQKPKTGEKLTFLDTDPTDYITNLNFQCPSHLFYQKNRMACHYSDYKFFYNPKTY